MKSRILLLVISALIINNTYTQDLSKTKQLTEYIKIIDSLSRMEGTLDEKYIDEDAYFVNKNKIIFNTYYSSLVNSYRTVSVTSNSPNIAPQKIKIPSVTLKTFPLSAEINHYKIKLLTKNGVDNYGSVFIPIEDNDNLLYFETIVYKSDGTIDTLDEGDVFKIELSEENYYRDHIKYPIPNIQPNDIIQVSYISTRETLNFGEDIYIHSFLPIELFTFTLSTRIGIETDIKALHGLHFPSPIIEDGHIAHSWNLKEVPTYLNQENIDISIVPFIRFAVRKIPTYLESMGQYSYIPRDWNKVGNLLLKTYQLNDCKKKYLRYFKKWMKEIVEECGNNKTKVVDSIQSYLINEMVLSELPANKKELHSGYHLKNGHIDYDNMIRLYMDVFDYLEIYDYDIGLGANKFTTVFDSSFASSRYITDLFFIFKDKQNQEHLLFPPTNNTLVYLDEIPYTLEDTYYARIHNGLDSSYSIKKLPAKTFEENCKKQSIKINYSFESDTIMYDVSSTYLGNLAINSRGYYKYILSQSNFKDLFNLAFAESLHLYAAENIKIKNLLKRDGIKVDYILKAGNNIVKLESNKYILSLEDFMGERKLQYNDYEERTFDYIFDFPYELNNTYNLVFEKEIKVLNIDKLNKDWENKIGRIQLSCEQASEKSVEIETIIDYKAKSLMPEEYVLINEFNKSIDNIIYQKLIFETLDN